MAAATKREGGTEILVNMSDYEQSFMTLDAMAAPDAERIATLGVDVQWSPHGRALWVGERALDWSGLPVTHIRAAMFVENPITLWIPAMTIKQDDTIRLPFELDRTAPFPTVDVAGVCVEVLANPAGHAGRSHELTRTGAKGYAWLCRGHLRGDRPEKSPISRERSKNSLNAGLGHQSWKERPPALPQAAQV